MGQAGSIDGLTTSVCCNSKGIEHRDEHTRKRL